MASVKEEETEEETEEEEVKERKRWTRVGGNVKLQAGPSLDRHSETKVAA